ncbi:SDR family oxidoreductase [Limnoraphis robusta Tam1]|uniref:SDR family oxidoreductase n=1 Tax=Limnoraphis robusta CCNP1315 TaxID=3110306 RepID=A0ABU5TUQ5_9CYAN|nr:SDR family oxidoreductase [Limnoraphis robusta]MEA5500528.1 SDR family oxidoreductase [Limnoraphis robusta BA-68 BA1]MEA5518632.1 SDR family oxidoreductase [Limnoraphis robusta CCNP1315]MEA5543223.1 SDR family oxidoreductase [Limnoraphis robusta Tam1]MEA5548502.1 SDR family oxidoreductase [Limnoraphis robusta CCNP1324]
MTITPDQIPAQHQERKPGLESEMTPKPEYDDPNYKGSGKLQDKVALITGGDSGIGRSVAVYYAKEGADVAIVYLNETNDAQETKKAVEAQGRRCLLIEGDIRNESFCQEAVKKTVDEFGKLDILVNNAAEQYYEPSIEEIDSARLGSIFATNIFSMFYFTKAAMPHLKEGSTIINTTSINAYKGNASLLSYSSTKGAILAFTRSLSQPLIEKGIRVNGVAPGPIWTPFIPDAFGGDDVSNFGKQVPMKRPGQPKEVAPCFVFLASEDSSYMAGQVLHPNGGVVVNA